MRFILPLILLTGLAIAADPPKPPDTRDVEISALKAQIAQLQIELQIATLPEVMRARLAAIDTSAALKSVQDLAKPQQSQLIKPTEPQSQSQSTIKR